MKVIYRVEALSDLDQHLSFIATQSPAIALNVGERILNSISRLELFPNSGRTGRVPGSFELVIPQLPYIAVYRVTDFVEITAIFHTAQDPNAL